VKYGIVAIVLWWSQCRYGLTGLHIPHKYTRVTPDWGVVPGRRSDVAAGSGACPAKLFQNIGPKLEIIYIYTVPTKESCADQS